MTTTRLRVVVVIAALTLSLLVPVAGAQAVPPKFQVLEPGKPARLGERKPVQIVFLGYEQNEFDEGLFRQYLKPSARTIDRKRSFETETKTPFGLNYKLDNSIVFADAAYEDAFFGHLLDVGVNESDLTGYDESLYQYLYNQQAGRSVDITNNLVVDATSVEQWLVEHPAPGVDPNRDTVVFIDWWGRPDFRFHEYVVAGDPQTETGANFAQNWEHRMIAWGGTAAHDEETGFGRASRTWFHDLSAGPDWNTDNWVIDNDFGLGIDPNVMTIFPPTWDYANDNAANRWTLAEALGVIYRFVAVNAFFASSPLYGFDDDAIMSDDVELDVTIASDINRNVFTAEPLQRELSDLLGYAPPVDVSEMRLGGPLARCHSDFASLVRCRPNTDEADYDVYANLYLGVRHIRDQWQDGSAEHEAPGFVIGSPLRTVWLGASLEAANGNRAVNFTLPRPESLDRGYGPTSTLIHEYGHYFGLSHGHDSYEDLWGDYQYAANGHPVFHFAWIGSEVNGAMSYLFSNDDFSQFDLDNYRRWQTVRYLRAANMIAGDVLKSAQASSGFAGLQRADASFRSAERALAAHDYLAASTYAHSGYWAVRDAATATGTAVPKSDKRWQLVRGKHGEVANSPSVHPLVDLPDAKPVPAEVVARFERTSRVG